MIGNAPNTIIKLPVTPDRIPAVVVLPHMGEVVVVGVSVGPLLRYSVETITQMGVLVQPS